MSKGACRYRERRLNNVYSTKFCRQRLHPDNSETNTNRGIMTYDVGKKQFRRVLAVVPVTMVNPLSQQLNRRLCSVPLFRWHVEVVHKCDTFLTERRSIHAFATSDFIKAPNTQINFPEITGRKRTPFFVVFPIVT